MRGRSVGSQLETKRAVECARKGLQLVHNGTPGTQELETLHTMYAAPIAEFEDKCLTRIAELTLDVEYEDSTSSAIEIAMLAGLLVDRRTANELLLKQVPDTMSLKRARNGLIGTSGGEETFFPYKGKES